MSGFASDGYPLREQITEHLSPEGRRLLGTLEASAVAMRLKARNCAWWSARRYTAGARARRVGRLITLGRWGEAQALLVNAGCYLSPNDGRPFAAVRAAGGSFRGVTRES